MRVAISPRSFRQVPGRHQDMLAETGWEAKYPQADRHLSEDEMVELAEGCQALLVGIDPVTERVMDSGPLRAIAKFGTGLDNIDLEAAGARGIPVRNTPGANSQGVAELTIAFLFGLARHIVAHHRSAADGEWRRWMGTELAGKRLGLVGLGEVGRRVTAMARGLGMEVVGHDPYSENPPVPTMDMGALLESSWAVSLHVPLTPETRGMIGRAELHRMPPGGLLINTARGGLVDEEAVAEALSSGDLGGAAFDDLETRPPPDSPLWDERGFLTTPHAGASTTEAVERTGMEAVEAIREELGL